MSREDIRNPKVQGRFILTHYVIGGNPGQAVLESAGVSSQVEYYQSIIQTIAGWSTLSLDEIEAAIHAAPDTIENSKTPNFKPLYLQAVSNLRNQENQAGS